jgi:hypothetical protein
MCLRQVLALNPEHTFAREWFDEVMTAEHLGALALPFVDETAVRPPPAEPVQPVAEPPMAKVLSLDTVPVQRIAEAEPAAAEASPARAVVQRPRILVVDDSATASSGLEALSAMSHAAPDLVLLDVGLPNLDGHLPRACKASSSSASRPSNCRYVSTQFTSRNRGRSSKRAAAMRRRQAILCSARLRASGRINAAKAQASGWSRARKSSAGHFSRLRE